MIIHLNKSRLFTTDPDVRFSQENGVPLGVWNEMWRRYKILEYTPNELCEYFHIRVGKKPTNRQIKRWIWRAEVYSLVLSVSVDERGRPTGASTVLSSFFGDYEEEVIREVTKHMRSGGKKSTRILA